MGIDLAGFRKRKNPVTNGHLFFWKTDYLFGVVLLLTSGFFMFREKLAFAVRFQEMLHPESELFRLLSIDKRTVIQQNLTIPSNIFYKEVDATFRFRL